MNTIPPASCALTTSLCLRLVVSKAIPPSWVCSSPIQRLTFQVRKRCSALEGDRKRKQVKDKQGTDSKQLQLLKNGREKM